MTKPAGRIVVFGATGYTGRITSKHLVLAGETPILVGRSAEKLRTLVGELAPLARNASAPTFEVADANLPGSVRRLITGPDDVLITTVGPYRRVGAAAVTAVIDAGAAYLDVASEPAFLRSLFTERGAVAASAGARILPSFGYEFVPGHLAASLLLDRRPDVTALHVGYFVTGPFAPSSGTLGSTAGAMLDDSFAWRHGGLAVERPAARVRGYDLDGRRMEGLSTGGTEHLVLPRNHPQLSDISVDVGWAGRWARAASAAGALATNAMQLPGVGQAMGAVVRSTVGGVSAEGQPDHMRARSRSVTVADGFAADGTFIDRVRVEGPSPYDLSGALLTWAARMLVRRRAHGTGVLGPVEAFGFEALVSGCLALGLAEES